QRFGLQIEFARYGGVGSAARKVDQATVVGGIQNIIALPNPVLFFIGGKFVEVEDCFPFGFGLFEFFECGAPEDAADIVGVAPEVVIPRAVLGDVWNAFLGIEDGEQAASNWLEVRRGFKLVGADCILGACPVERLVAGDVFEPLVGIVCGLNGGRR